MLAFPVLIWLNSFSLHFSDLKKSVGRCFDQNYRRFSCLGFGLVILFFRFLIIQVCNEDLLCVLGYVYFLFFDILLMLIWIFII